MLVKGIKNVRAGYEAKLEQHGHLYVIKYKDKDNDLVSPPVSDLTLALDLFNKLLEKEDRIGYN